MPAPLAPAVAPKPPRRFFLTLLELIAIGSVGWSAFIAVSFLLAAGLGLLVVLGIGLIFLVALVYALYAVAAFEILRVDGLYNLGAEPLEFAPRPEPGFMGWVKSLLSQLTKSRMWIGLGSFAVTLIVGSGVVASIRGFITKLYQAISQMNQIARTPNGQQDSYYWMHRPTDADLQAWFPRSPWWGVSGPLWNLAAAALSLVVIVLLVFLGRFLAIAIIGTSVKTKQLTQQATQAQMQAQTNFMQREGAVRAADLERTRIERDLHDGVQPRLVSVAMTLGLAQQQIDSDPAKAKELVTEAHTSTKAAITELRQLARGIHASVLDDRGLDAALSALVGRSPVPTRLDVRLIDENGVPIARVNREAETAVYFSIAESLTNAAKHSRASECRIVVRLRPGQNPEPAAPRTGTLWARIEDNGVGGATVAPGGGLDGIINRIQAAGGNARLDSPVNGPTSLEVSVPCAY